MHWTTTSGLTSPTQIIDGTAGFIILVDETTEDSSIELNELMPRIE